MANFLRRIGQNIAICVFIGVIGYAIYAFAELSSPPPLETEPVSEQHYLFELYSHMNRPDVTTTAPNGNVKAKQNTVILYNNAGTYSLWVNTDGNTTWQVL